MVESEINRTRLKVFYIDKIVMANQYVLKKLNLVFIIRLSILLFLIAFYSNIGYSKPILSQSSYLIGCLKSVGEGTVGLGTVNYPFAFYPDRNSETALASDFWIIREQLEGGYSFQNSQSLLYLKYDANAATERNALVFTDQLENNSTLFSLELKQVNNLSYYVIHSLANPIKVWNTRNTLYENLYPIGVYSQTNGDNESFIFYDTEGSAVVDDEVHNSSFVDAGPTLGIFKNYMSTFTIGGKVPVAATETNEFFISIPEDKMGRNVGLAVHYQFAKEQYKLFINSVEVMNGAVVEFGLINSTSKIPIEIRSGNSTLVQGTLIFSSLPLVQLYTDHTIQSLYILGRLIVTEAHNEILSEILYSNIKYRGALAAGLPKKSYALKLKSDIDGTTAINRSFFGLRNDNDWILDAMYIDPARMRNRVSTDLWNSFATYPYYYDQEPTMINGTRGKFVELFLNDTYQGLYCMTEKIDRKQLKLKRFIQNSPSDQIIQRGGLYKAVSWSVSTLLGNKEFALKYNQSINVPIFNNNSEVWASYEVKYPDLGDGESIDWKPLYDGVILASHHTNDMIFQENVAKYFDLPVFLDYYLFIELMLASDNHGKNSYLYIYDQTSSPKLSIAPWDLDGTWGRRWDGSSSFTNAAQYFPEFIDNYEHAENNLYIRLRELDFNNYNQLLIERYRQLRGMQFSYDNLLARFKRYAILFEQSGAFSREILRWGNTSLQSEMQFLSSWIETRLLYLDIQYLGAPYKPNYIDDNTKSGICAAPNPSKNQLTFSNLPVGQVINIYSLQGNLVAEFKVTSNILTVDLSFLRAGLYFVNTISSATKIIKE